MPSCCKPFRLIELVSVAMCLNLLVFSRLYDPGPDTSIPFETLIYAYCAYGSMIIITAIDVFCQLFGDPIAETPMLLFSAMSSMKSMTAGILFFLEYMSATEGEDTYHFFFILVLLAAFALFTAAAFTVDNILVVRCSSLPPDDI